MKFFIGTSGWQYGHWENGVFYPPDVKDRLQYITERLNSIEVNSSFYRIPNPDTVQRWAEKVPDRFKLVMKAPRSVSHRRWLRLDSEAPVRPGLELLLYFI